jgi:hypothetical protein
LLDNEKCQVRDTLSFEVLRKRSAAGLEYNFGGYPQGEAIATSTIEFASRFILGVSFTEGL